jgi:hypothetical protein
VAKQTMTLRERLDLRLGELKSVRQTYEPHWKDLASNLAPRRPRWMVDDNNKGDRRNSHIVDNTALLALRTLRAGMMSGLTSPARTWFELTTRDPRLAENLDVKRWLHDVGKTIDMVFLRSNLYTVLPVSYSDAASFGTAALLLEEDFEQVVIFTSLPLGSYWLGVDAKGKPDTFFREMEMTCAQVVEKFLTRSDGEIDFSKASVNVKTNWETGAYGAAVAVVHAVAPNPEYRADSPLARHKKFLSRYYEPGEANKDKWLRESGFDLFPVLVPRWELVDGDAYGSSCPGMDALGDIKQLQHVETTILGAQDRAFNGPKLAPVGLKTANFRNVPGAITYVDPQTLTQGLKPVDETQYPFEPMEGKQQQTRGRIRRAFFEDLFLMLTNENRATPPTAAEIHAREREKMDSLGSVLEQLNQDLLDPLIENTFAILVRQGWIAEPPEALRGARLGVEYISILAQAQRLMGIGAVDRMLSVVVPLAQVSPGVLDRVNFDEVVLGYGEMLSVPPKMLRSDDEMQVLQQQREAAQAAQARAAQVAQVAQGAKALSETDTEGKNALTDLLAQAGA